MRRNIFRFPPGKKRQPNAIIRGKNHLDCTRKGRSVARGNNRCPEFKISCPSLHTCDSTSEAVGLFTSCSHPISLALGLRLQIRNRFSTSQEKIGILFSFSVQKNLDEKRFSDGPIFSLVRVPLTSFALVRQVTPMSQFGPFNLPSTVAKMFAKEQICSQIRKAKEEMKSAPEPNRLSVGWIGLLLICPAVFLSACAIALPPAPAISHVVLLWLKDPDREQDREQLEQMARNLQRLPGVVRVETRRSLPPIGHNLPEDFDLAIVITFRDRSALRLYENDPRRLEAMRRYLRPMVRRYEVHNLSDR